MISERGQALLQAIVDEYIHDAVPIASAAVVQKYSLNVSPATVRNDMAHLEEEGYVMQPHTSAGRIPTEKGYRFYVDHCLHKKKISEKQRRLIDYAMSVRDESIALRSLAKTIAEMSSDAVFLGFSPHDTYYTGLRHLFAKPEFRNLTLVMTMTDVVDHLDDILPQLFDRIVDEPIILIGTENPLGMECSAIVMRYGNKKKQTGIFGIFGPLRMDYALNIALVRYAQELVTHR